VVVEHQCAICVSLDEVIAIELGMEQSWMVVVGAHLKIMLVDAAGTVMVATPLAIPIVRVIELECDWWCARQVVET
jgi:hypothetical protein